MMFPTDNAAASLVPLLLARGTASCHRRGYHQTPTPSQTGAIKAQRQLEHGSYHTLIKTLFMSEEGEELLIRVVERVAKVLQGYL